MHSNPWTTSDTHCYWGAQSNCESLKRLAPPSYDARRAMTPSAFVSLSLASTSQCYYDYYDHLTVDVATTPPAAPDTTTTSPSRGLPQSKNRKYAEKPVMPSVDRPIE